MGMVFGKTGVAEPTYDLLLSKAASVTTKCPYELRRYATRFAIETEYGGKGQEGNGFMTLAGYIGVGSAPQNSGQSSIAMTAPVVTQQVKDKGTSIAMTAPVVTQEMGNQMKMQFILPAEYTSLKDIPKPTNPRVKIIELPPQVGAVHKFSGLVKQHQAREKVKALVNQLQSDGVQGVTEESALEQFLLWQYNPPFTIPNLRRNEVWLELTEEQVQELMKEKDLN